MAESHDPTRDDSSGEILKELRGLLPSELACLDDTYQNVEPTPVDIRLKELIQKIDNSVFVRTGRSIEKGSDASVEEMQEFAKLLKEKAARYSRFADLLEIISRRK